MSVSFGGFSFNLGGGPEEGPVLSAGSPLSGVDGDAENVSYGAVRCSLRALGALREDLPPAPDGAPIDNYYAQVPTTRPGHCLMH